MARFLVVVTLLLIGLSCTPAPPTARCVKVTSRAELIGGPRALGEVGDFLLENDKVRFIVQDQGFSRGFGVFGGALLDADLVRPENGRGDSSGGKGRDNLGEMFPAFFLQAIEPREVQDPNAPGTTLPAIEIESVGGGDAPAVLVVRGTGNDFLALTQTLNELALGDDRVLPRYLFETRYILHPGKQFLEMKTTVQNIDVDDHDLPNLELFGAAVPTPLGDVVLFGAGNKVFLPHEAGFDLRFRLQEVYENGNIELPAFPGLVAEFIASSGPDVSYGVLPLPPSADDGVSNFAFTHKDIFPDATDHSVHVPFIASAFTGVFQALPPTVLAANDGVAGGADQISFRRLLIVGDGDVASVSDVVYEVLGDETGTLEGRVSQDVGAVRLAKANVIVINERGTKVTQALTDAGGRFRANLRPGTYALRVYKPGYDVFDVQSVTVTAQQTQFVDVIMPAAAELIVTIVEPNVGRVPGKATLMGTAPAGFEDRETRTFLFDLAVGEPFRYTDMIPDRPDDVRTRRYIEDADYAAGDGVVRFKVRPGTYTLVVGRGIEYSRFEQEVTLTTGATTTVTATVERVIDTTGYVSGDFHLHSQFSLDSSATLEDRITAYAAEGVELAVSTDHNFVVDYQPIIAKLGMEKHISSIVGLELTTIDRGHFNGFPLALQAGSLVEQDAETQQFVVENIASRTYGSFEWALRTPKQIFDDMRKLGRKDANGALLPVIVQANHPRDAMLGYFNVYGLEPTELLPLGPSGLIAPNPNAHPEFAGAAFSFDFDAVEVFNGKRLDLLKTFTVPPDAPRILVPGDDGREREAVVDPITCCEVQVGDVLVERPPFPCDGDVAGDCEAGCNADHFQRALDAGNCERGGRILFPSVADDWIRMNEMGKRVVGTASSDSHDNDGEPGYPRTYLRASSDEPLQLGPQTVTDAFTAGDVFLTNGPFLRVDVDGAGLGEVAGADAGFVTLHVKIDCAPWLRVNELRVRRGVDVVERIAIGGADGTSHEERDVRVEVLDVDTLLTVEVEGPTPLFPSIVMNEVPPLGFTEALGSIGQNFGLGSNPNALRPLLTGVTTPYALTNPLYIDADGDGEWTPPRQPPQLHVPLAAPAPARAATSPYERPWVETEDEARRRELLESVPLQKRLALERMPLWLWPSDRPGDVRRVLLQFARHAH